MRTELLTIRYQRSNAWILAAAVAGTVLTGLFMVFLTRILDVLVALEEVFPNATDADTMSRAAVATLDPGSPGIMWFLANITGASGGRTGSVVFLALLAGALSVTTRFRFGSIVPAVLAEPRRTILVARTLAGISLVAIGAGLVLTAVSGALLAVASLVSATAAPPMGELLVNWGVGVIAVSLMATIGACIGFLTRSPLWAVLIIVALCLVDQLARLFESIVATGVSPVTFLPMGLPSVSVRNGDLMGMQVATPGPALGLLALALWTALAAGLAMWRTRNSSLEMR